VETHDKVVTFQLDAVGTYDFMIEWDDSSRGQILSHDQADVKHTYARVGEHTVQLNGTVHGLSFGLVAHPCCRQIIDISQWDCV